MNYLFPKNLAILLLICCMASCITYNITINYNGCVEGGNAMASNEIERTSEDDGYFYFKNIGDTIATIWTENAHNRFYDGMDNSGMPSGSPIYYSDDDRETWIDTDAAVSIKPGEKVIFKRDDPYHKINMSFASDDESSLEIGGNIMSLAYGDDFAGKTSILASDYFTVLFQNIENLSDASRLLLPATSLSKSCYFGMFYNCKSLLKAPELPAVSLADSCYARMFEGCRSLTSAPKLNAEKLAKSCYFAMLYKCESLKEAPELPAMVLADSCYSSMLRCCTSLASAPELPALVLRKYCYSDMFLGCSGLSKGPDLRAKKLARNCYYHMFWECWNLSSISVDFTKWGNTDFWLNRVSFNGTIHCPRKLDCSIRDASHIPVGWNVVRK